MAKETEGLGFKICRKLLATTLLKLNPNVQINHPQFNQIFVVKAVNPEKFRQFINEDLQTLFIANKKDFRNGLLSLEGKVLKFEMPYLIQSVSLKNNMLNLFRLLLEILHAIDRD